MLDFIANYIIGVILLLLIVLVLRLLVRKWNK